MEYIQTEIKPQKSNNTHLLGNGSNLNNKLFMNNNSILKSK